MQPNWPAPSSPASTPKDSAMYTMTLFLFLLILSFFKDD
jgi:hypothetical protein